MTKLQPVESEGKIVGYYFRCPGCQHGHVAHINPHKNTIGAGWTFNGNMEKPTFSPSILNRAKFDESWGSDEVCHIFVTDGQIQFLNDCTHSLAGQTVDMPDLDESA